MKTHNRYRMKEKCFTLIEMIVALAVFLIVVAIILIFYNSAFNATKLSSAKNEALSNAQIALDIISRDIASIYYEENITPFWHKPSTEYPESDPKYPYNNELLAFISTTPLPQQHYDQATSSYNSDSSSIYEVKYQLYYDPTLSTDSAGWIMRSATGDGAGTLWNFYGNFTVGTDSSDAFTLDAESSNRWLKLTQYVTDLEFKCIDKNGKLISPSDTTTTQLPFLIEITLKIMNRSSWLKLKSIAAGRDIYGSYKDIQNFRKRFERTFKKIIYIGNNI